MVLDASAVAALHAALHAEGRAHSLPDATAVTAPAEAP